MKRKLLIIACALFFGSSSFAQQGDGGSPIAFNAKSCDWRSFTTPDIEALRAEDEINDVEKISPWRFGFNNYTDFNFNNSGTWKNLPNGGKVWQIKITCENALTVNLTFEDLVIPEGNELYVFNPEKDFILGKFTDKHIYQGQLGTELVPGQTTIVEYYVAPANLNAGRDLTISTVTHGYRTAAEYQTKAFGSSGSCNMNSACPDGIPWENQIRATMMLVSGSNGFCTGSMINNTQNDGTPYVLTANHCYSNPTNWIFRFNWASANCSNPGSSPNFESISGAVLRSRRTPSDFCLVEITGGLENGSVPIAFNTYFPGWDNSDVIPSTAVCVHHPSGDIKKLAFDDNALQHANGMGSSEANSQWRLQWDRNTTTEPGSSGSPLFDQNGRIVGQLWGGGASCSQLNSPDYYGKVSYSWEPSGSNSTNQLKFWLDPTNTGATSQDGFDPITYCNSTYDYSTGSEELCYGDDSGSATVVFLTGIETGATFDIGSGPQATGVFTGLPQGTYTVDVTDGEACVTSVTVVITGPAQMTTGGGTSAEITPFSGSVNLSVFGGTPGFTYAWTGPNGFTAATEDISGLEGGTYDVIVTDANGCTNTASYTVNSFVSVDDLETIDFNLYPNPSNGAFNVQLTEFVTGTYNVTVMDLAGRVIFANTMENTNEFIVDLSNSASGTYMLQISTNDLYVTKRIVLEK